MKPGCPLAHSGAQRAHEGWSRLLQRLASEHSMNLDFARLIAYHLAGQGGVEDPEHHLPWAFAHAIGNLSGPADKSGIFLSDGEPIVRWLVDSEVPRLFTVVGQVIPNDEDELR